MVGFQPVLVVTVVVLAVGGTRADGAQGRDRQKPSSDRTPVTQVAAAGLGRIAGAITDADGWPLAGAMVSAFGPTGAKLAVSDAAGRFMLRSLVPGSYFVQAHLPGYVASRRELVLVTAGTPAVHAIGLSRIASAPASGPIAASVGLPPRADDGPPDGEEPDLATSEPATPHDHSEKAWRLRRARRSVLKQAEAWVAGVDAPEVDRAGAGSLALLSRRVGSRAPFARGSGAFPVTGEVNLLTRGTLEPANAANVLVGAARPAGIANLLVGAPAWQGDWTAQGAMTTGDVMSWAATGSYVADVETTHRIGFDVAYGRQRYEGGNRAALTIAAESRYAASFSGSDRWTVSDNLTIDYGGRYSTYGYIEKEGLFSPRAAVTVTPVAGFRVRVATAQETVAPGAEEFLPPADTGLWLPPERTFAAFSLQGGLHPERTRHLEVGIERDLANGYVVGVRRFYQDVSDQMATLFGADEFGNAATGHYYIARAGSVTSRGWMVTLRRQLGGRFSGSVDYTLAEAHWAQAGAAAALGVEAAVAMRPAVEQIHDLSGSVETEIPETATRVFVRCRINGAFIQSDLEDPSGLDARFDVLVHQALPFSPFDGSRWEVLLAVRSLFFDPKDTASMFNELLVVRPPRQVVGGVVVHF